MTFDPPWGVAVSRAQQYIVVNSVQDLFSQRMKSLNLIGGLFLQLLIIGKKLEHRFKHLPSYTSSSTATASSSFIQRV